MECLFEKVLPRPGGMEHLIRKDHPRTACRKLHRHLRRLLLVEMILFYGIEIC
jgi:hypothetical protein